jgi:DNA polymerase-4
MAKPDGLLVVPRSTTVQMLHSLPVEAIWGVGEQTRAVLGRWGITNVAQLAQTDLQLLQRIVGTAAGRHLHDLAWGRDLRPVVPSRPDKSLGAETTFDVDSADLAWIEGRLLELADRTAGELRERGLLARTISLKVRTGDWQTLTRSRTLGAPTDVAQEVFGAARDLLAGVELAGRAVRLIGVRAEGLSSALVRQPTLDEAVDGPGRRAAEQAMDEVRRRFGASAVRSGSALVVSPAPSTTAPRAAELS